MRTPEIWSPEHTDCLDFIEALRASIPPLLPGARFVIDHMLAEARCASHIGDTRAVVHLMAMVREKVAIELYVGAEAIEGDYVVAATLRAIADEFDADVGKHYIRRDQWVGDDQNEDDTNHLSSDISVPPAINQGDNERMSAANVPPIVPPGNVLPPSSSDKASSSGDRVMRIAANVPPFEPEPVKPERIGSAVMDLTQTPSPEQLARPHQRITLRNTDDRQTHWFTDRFGVGHELRPGQSKEIDMTTEAIQVHAHRVRTDRGVYPGGPNAGKPFPAHPVKIVGLGPKEILQP